MKKSGSLIAVLGLLLAMTPLSRAEQKLETATFAGGCFWCVESAFEEIPGVTEAVSGYAGGPGDNPTYQDYAEKGHVEVVQISYDPSTISYSGLLDIFWRQINPTDAGGQFVDRGPAYRSAVFYHGEEQKRQAEESREALGRSGRYDQPIVTEIVPAAEFYPAENYHQDYYKKNSVKYKYYRFRSGRDQYLQKIWGRE